MSLFSPEEKEEFESVGVGVYKIEMMLPEKYHPIFKDLIEAILSEESIELDTKSSAINISKKEYIILQMRISDSPYRGLAAGLEKQYTLVKSSGYLSAYTAMDAHKNEWVPFNDEEKIFAAMRQEMDKEDMELYLSLPDKVTVYRGADVDELANEDFGFSWTLKQDIARKFATETASTKDRVILKAIVDKDYIAVYTNAREEEECIINTKLEDWFEDIEEISSK